MPGVWFIKIVRNARGPAFWGAGCAVPSEACHPSSLAPIQASLFPRACASVPGYAHVWTARPETRARPPLGARAFSSSSPALCICHVPCMSRLASSSLAASTRVRVCADDTPVRCGVPAPACSRLRGAGSFSARNGDSPDAVELTATKEQKIVPLAGAISNKVRAACAQVRGGVFA